MIAIGIDPGKHGAIAMLSNDEACLWDTPLIGTDYDIAGMGELLHHMLSGERGPIMAGIEQAKAMPTDGRTAAFETGRGYGLWLAWLAACHIPYEVIRPQAWKHACGLLRAPKEASRARARQLFPALDLSLKKHHGRAEALLIAFTLRRKWYSHHLGEGESQPAE